MKIEYSIWTLVFATFLSYQIPVEGLTSTTAITADLCYGNPCRNHSCTAGSICACNQGYFNMADHNKLTCIDRDECKQGHTDPCNHRGVCLNTIGSYSCQCLQGWSGVHCQNNTTEHATCMPGYKGEYCNITLCNHGYSVNSSANYSCICDQGWTNDHPMDTCHDIDECNSPHTCQNNGSCTNTNGSYTCNCTVPWEDTNCTFYNSCISHQCINGGKCVTNGTEEEKYVYTCKCPKFWQGQYCEFDVDECDINNTICGQGNCTNTNGSYNCSSTSDSPTTEASIINNVTRDIYASTADSVIAQGSTGNQTTEASIINNVTHEMYASTADSSIAQGSTGNQTTEASIINNVTHEIYASTADSSIAQGSTGNQTTEASIINNVTHEIYASTADSVIAQGSTGNHITTECSTYVVPTTEGSTEYPTSTAGVSTSGISRDGTIAIPTSKQYEKEIRLANCIEENVHTGVDTDDLRDGSIPDEQHEV